MIPFASSLFAPVSYLARSAPLNDRGAPQGVYAPAVVVMAAVESRRIERLETTGEVTGRAAYTVYLRDDPSSLNGGLGIVADDAFSLPTGEFVQVQDSPARESLGRQCVLWRVECLDVT